MPKRLREGPWEFNVDTPGPSPDQVRAALDQLRPGLIADGGNVELASIEEDGTVIVDLQGACASCPAAGMTMRLVVEPYLRRTCPGVTAVVAV
jgi:Fe-S cluster biogenesis protein NfuA